MQMHIRRYPYHIQKIKRSIINDKNRIASRINSKIHKIKQDINLLQILLPSIEVQDQTQQIKRCLPKS